MQDPGAATEGPNVPREYSALTSSEVRSLVRLGIPRSLRLPDQQTWPSQTSLHPGKSGILRSIVRRFSRLRAFPTSRNLALEGSIYIRHEAGRRVIVGVSEDISFAHRVGFGTAWRTESGFCFVGTPKAFLLRCLSVAELAIPSILPVSLRKWMLWEGLVPSPPPPLCEQRRLASSYKALGLSTTMMKLTINVSRLPFFIGREELPS